LYGGLSRLARQQRHQARQLQHLQCLHALGWCQSLRQPCHCCKETLLLLLLRLHLLGGRRSRH
jgi:hypothetical protein